jgi:hypothetical protein
MQELRASPLIGLVLVGIATLALARCVSLDEQLKENRARLDAINANLREQWRSEDAARAATENCGANRTESDCWTREYQRHLSDPVCASAEDSKNRHRRSDVLLAKWSKCYFDKARELAYSDLPAPEAASEAFARCDKERQDWVRAQGSSIRSSAEYVATGSERTAYPLVLGLIGDLRRGRR